MAITIEFFHDSRKYSILKHPFIIKVRKRMVFFGRFLSAAFEIVFSTGTLRPRSRWIILNIVTGIETNS